jgi:hypothetical protein
MALIANLHIDNFRLQWFGSTGPGTESVEEKKKTKECQEDNPRERASGIDHSSACSWRAHNE